MPCSTSQFSYSKKDKSFVTELSSLGPNVFSPLGLVLVSDRTQVATLWQIRKELRSSENEIQGWELQPSPETLKKVPGVAGHTVTIFND